MSSASHLPTLEALLQLVRLADSADELIASRALQFIERYLASPEALAATAAAGSRDVTQAHLDALRWVSERNTSPAAAFTWH